MVTWELVKDVSHNFTGKAMLYELSEPVEYGWDWKEKKPKGKTKFVVASGTVAAHSGPETYLFPANEDGKVIDWGEMDGSEQGYINPSRAIQNLVDLVNSGEYHKWYKEMGGGYENNEVRSHKNATRASC